MTTATNWRNRIVGYGEEAPDQLAANPRNWRIHPQHQQDALHGLLGDVGWVQNILVNRRTGYVVDGHARVALALRHGQAAVPVTYVDLADDEEALVLASLDPIGALAERDEALLGELLAEIETGDAGLAALLDGLREETGDGGATGLGDPDAVPEPSAEPITRPGDLWVLGDHRLLCGSCTDVDAVRFLMDGQRARLLATDPPYLVDYTGGNHPQHWTERDGQMVDTANETWDTYHEGDEALYHDVLRIALAEALLANAPVYQWHADRRRRFVEDAWRANGLLWHQTITWVKSRPVLTRSHFMWQTEPCAYGWVAGNQPDPARRPPSNTPNVWLVDSVGRDEVGDDQRVEHPTQKPVELITRPIAYHTRPGELLYEPFSGSGTAIIAAELTGRRCYAMELEPVYCDVAVKRWELFTGRAAERVPAAESA